MCLVQKWLITFCNYTQLRFNNFYFFIIFWRKCWTEKQNEQLCVIAVIARKFYTFCIPFRHSIHSYSFKINFNIIQSKKKLKTKNHIPRNVIRLLSKLKIKIQFSAKKFHYVNVIQARNYLKTKKSHSEKRDALTFNTIINIHLSTTFS